MSRYFNVDLICMGCLKAKEVSRYRIIRARPQDYALRRALRNLPRPTFEEAYIQTMNALKARPMDEFNKNSSKTGLIAVKR
jgi:hypothetical protein